MYENSKEFLKAVSVAMAIALTAYTGNETIVITMTEAIAIIMDHTIIRLNVRGAVGMSNVIVNGLAYSVT